MVFTETNPWPRRRPLPGGNEAAHGAVVSVFNHQSSTLPPAGKARSTDPVEEAWSAALTERRPIPITGAAP